MWASGGGGLFDGSSWDGFVFDAGIVGQANVSLSGVSTSMGLLFNHVSTTDAPFVLAAAHVHYDVWGCSVEFLYQTLRFSCRRYGALAGV